MQMKAMKIAGRRAMKLYFVKTARLSANPSRAAFFKVDVLADKDLSQRKSTSTNRGIVVQSVPIVAAWITRTGRNVRKKTRPKWTGRDANRRSEYIKNHHKARTFAPAWMIESVVGNALLAPMMRKRP